MLNFKQFVNESKDHDFDSIEKGDVVLLIGHRYTVKKVGSGVIVLDGKNKELRVNKGMWKERNGKIQEKKKGSKKDEE
jgi:hypothetical protein